MDNMKVLLVDDEKELVATLEERLELRNIHAEFTLCGNKAVKLIEQKDYDVVVLDIHMPGMSGIDIMKTIKSIKPEVQVILLTGRGSEKDRQKGMELGAFDYVVKPVNIDILIEKMKKAVEGKKGNADV